MAHRKIKRLITRTSIFFIGAVFGFVSCILLAQLSIWTTIGKAVYDARVDQQEMDAKIFNKEATK
jgi:hypothetical protein